MTALSLALASLVPGAVALVAYWFVRIIDRNRRIHEEELRALAESSQGRALAKRVQVALDGGPTVATNVSAEPHIEVLKFRAAKLVENLKFNGNPGAALVVVDAIRAGDREALLALLRACDSA